MPAEARSPSSGSHSSTYSYSYSYSNSVTSGGRSISSRGSNDCENADRLWKKPFQVYLHKHWVNYPPCTSAKLVNACLQGKKGVSLRRKASSCHQDWVPYRIDFRRMRQINLDSGEEKKIRPPWGTPDALTKLDNRDLLVTTMLGPAAKGALTERADQADEQKHFEALADISTNGKTAHEIYEEQVARIMHRNVPLAPTGALNFSELRTNKLIEAHNTKRDMLHQEHADERKKSDEEKKKAQDLVRKSQQEFARLKAESLNAEQRLSEIEEMERKSLSDHHGQIKQMDQERDALLRAKQKEMEGFILKELTQLQSHMRIEQLHAQGVDLECDELILRRAQRVETCCERLERDLDGGSLEDLLSVEAELNTLLVDGPLIQRARAEIRILHEVQTRKNMRDLMSKTKNLNTYDEVELLALEKLFQDLIKTGEQYQMKQEDLKPVADRLQQVQLQLRD